ncbi:mitochondrial import inner membrane translocase subunit Tim9 [Eupeodes corollae]|uniref:mitochondrial import inner membrane translocase subunit Tim9 n=1 Tax=Eupeodes corollae TaxID=290404 RepID=UPI0024915101|nr:mitochondrial import inner membrane translocase subunit Tim9 [Eupeodes corollae]
MAAATVSIDSLDKEQMKTFQDFLLSYNKLSELCFVDCIRDFTARTVKPDEEKCSLNCMEKYLKMNQRISQRFQEFQMIANENALAAAQKTGKI